MLLTCSWVSLNNLMVKNKEGHKIEQELGRMVNKKKKGRLSRDAMKGKTINFDHISYLLTYCHSILN
jgi:hypothetical protein